MMFRRQLIATAAFLALLTVLGPTSAKEKEKELMAADAKLVVYSKEDKVAGAFTYIDKKVWVEDTFNGRHRFTETQRDEFSIYLDVEGGAYSIQIDLYKKKIFITNTGEQQREHSNVMKAF